MTAQERITTEILREYARMREVLDGLLALHDQKAEVDPGELRSCLRRLRTSMEAVFTSEEEHGLFNELLTLLPNASQRILALRDDHVALLKRVNSLIDRAERPDRESLESLRQDVQRFADQLEEHEAWEVRLFNRPHLRDEGGED